MHLMQPPAPNSPPKTTNLLELAIYEFEQKAKSYYANLAKNAPLDETIEAKNARIHQEKVDFAHLNSERTRIRQYAAIQESLRMYMENNETAILHLFYKIL